MQNRTESAIILFVSDADVAQPVARILGKDEVHEFDSRHQLQLKHLCGKRRGVSFLCIAGFFKGLLLERAGLFSCLRWQCIAYTAENNHKFRFLRSQKILLSSGFLRSFL